LKWFMPVLVLPIVKYLFTSSLCRKHLMRFWWD